MTGRDHVAVGVLGGGAWGQALAAACSRSGAPTFLYSRRGKGASNAGGADLPQGVRRAGSMHELGAQCRLVVIAVPSDVLVDVAHELGDAVDGRHLLVHAIRGLSTDDMAPLSEVLRRETPARRIGAISGPVQANELALAKPSVLIAGSHYPEVNDAVVGAFGSPIVRVYTTHDLFGLELASALMGCLAVGVGYAQQIGVGAGIVATLITRGVEEAARIAAAAGANERTLLGLAGYGDLLAAITQPDRPEVLFGAALAEGKSMEDALTAAKLRVEAATLIPRVAAWATSRGLACPIFQGLSARLREPIAPADLVASLMSSPRRSLD